MNRSFRQIISQYKLIVLLMLSAVGTIMCVVRTFHPPKKLFSPSDLIPPSSLYASNYCINYSIPYVASLRETALYFALTNHSLVRYGDGEVKMMLGQDCCTTQSFDPELSRQLRRVFFDRLPLLDMAIPDVFDGFPPKNKKEIQYWNTEPTYREWFLHNTDRNKIYYNAHITSPYFTTSETGCEVLEEVFHWLREIWKGKDIVLLRNAKERRLKYDIYDTARSQTILYAETCNAWDSYLKYKTLLLRQPPEKLVIITIGPTSKVLVRDLVKNRRRALDLGHLAKDYNLYKLGAVDPFFFES